MTGQGRGVGERDGESVEVELRTVNHRGLKVVVRGGDRTTPLETKIETAIRRVLTRGTVTVQVRHARAAAAASVTIDETVLQTYIDRLQNVRDTSVDSSLTLELSNLHALHGVMVSDDPSKSDSWPAVESALVAALDDLDRMRSAEGQAMAATLRSEVDGIESRIATLKAEAPKVAEEYADRLDTRIRAAIERQGVEVDRLELAREIAVFADRSDVSEEITRLESHIEMFRGELIRAEGAVGRKLDFIVQEMFREANTTGSKAGNAAITAEVVEIKCALERIRELVQNVE